LDNAQTYRDHELFRLVAAGDEQAFARLFHQHKQMVYNVAWTYTEDKSLSEDILQDVFVIVWKKRETLPEVKDFAAYLYTVAKNRALDVLRKQSADRARENKTMIHQKSWVPDHTVNISEEGMEALLQKALDILTPQQRRAFELRRMEDQSLEQISEAMDLSKNTVQNHLTLAHRKVRAFLLANLEISAVFLFLTNYFRK
jgi:RNA polymerase sigma-70 factor (family 1)